MILRLLFSLLMTVCSLSITAQERIYIQTDRSVYIPGDTIWFRAHLTDAASNIPSTSKHYPKNRSRFVYIELYDTKADTLVERIMIRRNEDGIFANAITLPRTLQHGHYTIVGYTKHMLNYPDTMFAYKEIEVY